MLKRLLGRELAITNKPIPFTSIGIDKLKSMTTTSLKENEDFEVSQTSQPLFLDISHCKSDHNLHLQATISQHEFHNVNHIIMKADSTLTPCKGKNDLVKALMDAPPQTNSAWPNSDTRYLIIDGMVAVQTLLHAAKFKFCNNLGEPFPAFTDSILDKYTGGRVIFGNYFRSVPIKDDIRYSSQLGHGDELYIDNTTPINDIKTFLASKTIKDRLTIYLADKLILLCMKPVVTVTRKDVLINVPYYHPITGFGTQEEADTLMILHALEVVNGVDFYTKDTDCWVLILRRLHMLGPNIQIITGTCITHKQVTLQPIHDELGP